MTRSCLLVLLGIRLAFAQTPIYRDIQDHFIDTKTSNGSINDSFAAAQNATFYSFDEEFLWIVGSSPTILKINASNSTFDYANEAGVWLPDRNEVWFTGSGGSSQPYFVLNLDTYTISPPNSYVAQPLPLLTGGDHFNGAVYFSGFGLNASNSTPPAIYPTDPATGLSLENIATDRPSKNLDAKYVKYTITEVTKPLLGQILHDSQPPALRVDDNDECEVDKILAQKPARGGRQQYLVKWTGYARPTWTPASAKKTH
ncbi:uncharacterized protein PAC_15595 [Phialocephala subalpina]|uniref:Chromo domain-containing protein n=1 Tax=Phialocephala subalpina TaxID=576137 RepID=A0A1L7XKV2_9HELO|nr:uncharacterized protein PAC_15595 [Phialocephala subalpina]